MTATRERAPLRVYLPAPDEAFISALRAQADPARVALHDGAPPEPADYQVLVAGRPSRAQLEASQALQALVIPFAGLPRETAELLSAFPQLRVHNLHHNAAATAEMAVGLLLALARRIPRGDAALRRLDWSPRYEPPQDFLCAGKRALILGWGAVGRRVGRACEGLGMRVRGVRRHPAPNEPRVHPVTDLSALLPEADVVVVTLPETAATRGLLGADELARLPAGALLINVGRARVVDEAALYEALTDGSLGGAGLDVWYRYPESREACRDVAPAERPFHTLPQVVLSPHRAGHVRETEGLRAEHLLRLLATMVDGHPPPGLDLSAGY